MLADGVGDPVVGSEVFAPSARQGGQPEYDPRDDCIKRGVGLKRMKCLVDVGGALLGQVGVPEYPVPQSLEKNCTNSDRNNVADGCGQLRTRDVGDKVGNFESTLKAPIVAHDPSKRRGCRGRLLGG